MDLSKLDVDFDSSDSESELETITESESVSVDTSIPQSENLSDKGEDASVDSLPFIPFNQGMHDVARKSLLLYADSLFIPLNKLLVNSGLSCSKRGPMVSKITDKLGEIKSNMTKTINLIDSMQSYWSPTQ
ncbi:hypothetical protein P9112_012628 [Eukaryota sp. TZLM1-RC]